MTKGKFGISVNKLSLDITSFSILKNIPGRITIKYLGNYKTKANISVFNINGQRVYGSIINALEPGNSFDITLNHSGVFFIKVEIPFSSQTFKALGFDREVEYSLETNNSSPSNISTKSVVINNDDNFLFAPGDSLRLSVYKDEYYARPVSKTIITDENINFLLEISSTVTNSISEAYVTLDEISTDIVDYDTLTGSVQIAYTGESPKFNPGDIITVDVDTMGYLRKIVEVVEEDGSIKVTTKQAYLNEVFVGKDFKLHTGLMNPGVQLKSTSSNKEISNALTDDRGYIHPVKVIYKESKGRLIIKSALTGLEHEGKSIPIIDFYRDLAMDLYGTEGDNIHFYVDEGHVSLTSDAIFEFDFDYEGELTEDTKVKKGDINTFSFYLDSHAEFLSKLALNMGKSYENEKEKKLIDLNKITAKFLIGPVPFWVTFDVDIFGNYHLSSDAALHADWGFESKHDLRIGGVYNRHTKKFNPIKEYTPDNTVFPMNIEGEINTSVRFEVYPRAEIKFYNFFGPYAEIIPYVQGNYNASMQSQITTSGSETFLAWNSNIDLGLDFKTGLELSFLGLSKEIVPTEINGPVWPLWQTPTRIEVETNLPTKLEPNSVQSLKFKVTDLLGLPVPICPIYITGDGNFNKQILLTDESGEVLLDWTIPSIKGEASINAVIYNADRTVIDKLSRSVNVSTEKSPPSVSTLPATEIGTNSAKLQGEVTSDGNNAIIERGFYYGKESNLNNKLIITGNIGKFEATASGLEPNETYYFKAFAENNSGLTSGSEIFFKTSKEQITPPILSAKEIIKLSNDSIQIEEVIISDGNGEISSKGICWNFTGKPTIEDQFINCGSGDNDFRGIISGIIPNQTYYIRGYATNSSGTGYSDGLIYILNSRPPLTFTEEDTEVYGGRGIPEKGTGNGDGKINIGENIYMNIIIKNTGEYKAYNIVGTLSLEWGLHEDICHITNSEAELTELDINKEEELGYFKFNLTGLPEDDPNSMIYFILSLTYEDENGLKNSFTFKDNMSINKRIYP